MGTTRIYVGNLPWSQEDEDMQQLFAEHGEVVSAEVIKDRDTGRSRGFGFVEMADEDGARKAIEALDQQDVGGRRLTVNVARSSGPKGGDSN